jgi:hypothetical protein
MRRYWQPHADLPTELSHPEGTIPVMSTPAIETPDPQWRVRLGATAQESARRRQVRAAERRERAERRSRAMQTRHAWRLTRRDARLARPPPEVVFP